MTAVTISNEQWVHGQESGVIWTTVDVVPEVKCGTCLKRGAADRCCECRGTGRTPIVGQRVEIDAPIHGDCHACSTDDGSKDWQFGESHGLFTVGSAIVDEALPIIDGCGDAPEDFLPWVVHYEDEPVELRRFSTEGEFVEDISDWLPLADWTPGRTALRLEVEG